MRKQLCLAQLFPRVPLVARPRGRGFEDRESFRRDPRAAEIDR